MTQLYHMGESRNMGDSAQNRTGLVGPGRLDKALADAMPDLSRERIKALISEGRLSVEGKRVTSASNARFEGKTFNLEIPPLASLSLTPEKLSLDIVHEDADLIVVDKPPGMVVHPAPGHDSGTLVHALLHHCRGQLSGIGGVERPGIVHRIDAGTSGLLVVAKSEKAHHGLAEQFADHSVERRYLALVKGLPSPAQGTITTMIGRSDRDRKKMAVTGEYDQSRPPSPSARGKHAVTHYAVQKVGREGTLITCQLETGRTHQVRVHMAHIGHPLIGDPLYARRRKLRQMGPVETNFGRQALHAATLGFIHPVTGDKMCFETPIPADMQELLREFFV